MAYSIYLLVIYIPTLFSPFSHSIWFAVFVLARLWSVLILYSKPEMPIQLYVFQWRDAIWRENAGRTHDLKRVDNNWFEKQNWRDAVTFFDETCNNNNGRDGFVTWPVCLMRDYESKLIYGCGGDKGSKGAGKCVRKVVCEGGVCVQRNYMKNNININ